MHTAQPAHVTQQRHVEPDDFAEELRIGTELFDGVVG